MEGPVRRLARNQAARAARPGDHLGVAQPQVARHQAEPVDVGQGEDGAGDGFGRRRRAGASGGRLRLSWGHCISKRL